MNAATSAVMTGILVATGRWANKKPINVQLAVAIMVYAIILSLLEDANEKFAKQVGLLVLVGAAFTYLPKVVSATVGKK